MKISDLLEKYYGDDPTYLAQVRERKEIMLGCMNDWSYSSYDKWAMYSDIQEFEGPVKCKKWGRCIEEFQKEISDGAETFLVTWECDSSD